MKKRLPCYLLTLCFLGFMPAYGNGDFENIIRMESDQYQTHYKNIVIFPHLEHADRLGISCGECHHDDNGIPREKLGIGDDVENCIACHSNPSYATGKPPEEQLEYHTNTLHLKCKGCHRAHNKRQGAAALGKKPAPIKCHQCHKGKRLNKNMKL